MYNLHTFMTIACNVRTGTNIYPAQSPAITKVAMLVNKCRSEGQTVHETWPATQRHIGHQPLVHFQNVHHGDTPKAERS
jgi:hypothetical protein